VGCVVLKIEIFNENEISSELDRKIRKGLCTSFPQYADHFGETRSWHGVYPVSSVVGFSDDENSRVIAHVGIVQRQILVNRNNKLVIFGIQNVFIHPDHRGSGLLGSLLNMVVEYVEDGSFDCGLLFCIPELERVYNRFSWKKINNPRIVKVDENDKEELIPEKNIAMFYPLRLTEFPEGDVNLQGNDW